MIRKVVLRRFKRFAEIEIVLGDHVVFAGPNNMGKTTVLQAIAAWELALRTWRTECGTAQIHHGAYKKVPLNRKDFAAVPLRRFELLWEGRNHGEPIEIELHGDGWWLGMEYKWDTHEQLYVRPCVGGEITHEQLKDTRRVPVVYVPPMSGLSREEPVYTEPKQRAMLGQGRPGEILRNLLVAAHADDRNAWDPLLRVMKRVFGVTLLPPDASGENILAEYQEQDGGPRLDIASAGSGFLQVLMLLTFLYTRAGSVLLVDEPDAHLHLILQGVVYDELKRLAARQGSQLILATHSEVIIDKADVSSLRVLTGTAAKSLMSHHLGSLKQALKVVQQADVVAALTAPGILYVEGYTDHALLLAWATILRHPAQPILQGVLVRTVRGETVDESVNAAAKAHFEAISLFFERPLRALEILDGDSKNKGDDKLEGPGLMRFRWRRYEVESYLVHPDVVARLVRETHGDTPATLPLLDAMNAWFDKLFRTHNPTDFVAGDEVVETILKARKAHENDKGPGLMTAVLQVVGIPIPYARYNQIAEKMLPEDIHPEIIERLDEIVKVFASP